MNERLWESAPEFRLPVEALNQTVGWSSANKKPVSLRDFIVSRAPETAKRFGLEPSSKRVKRVTELTEEELTETIYSRLRESAEDTVMVLVGEGEFSTDNLIQHVKDRSELGLRILSSTKRSLELLERLIEAGKLQGIESDAS